MARRWGALLAALLVGAAVAVAGAPAAAAARPYCGQVWGSQAEAAGGLALDPGRIVDVRAGRHACFDRLVVDADAPITAWSVRYVDQVRQDGSGFVVPLRGGARLEVVVHMGILPPDRDPAAVARATAFWTRQPLVDVAGFRTFRQVRQAGSFEGMSTIGVGVRSRLPFRVFTLPGPGSGSRLVLDVGHRWCASGSRC